VRALVSLQVATLADGAVARQARVQEMSQLLSKLKQARPRPWLLALFAAECCHPVARAMLPKCAVGPFLSKPKREAPPRGPSAPMIPPLSPDPSSLPDPTSPP
jgi:hypothetical protein